MDDGNQFIKPAQFVTLLQVDKLGYAVPPEGYGLPPQPAAQYQQAYGYGAPPPYGGYGPQGYGGYGPQGYGGGYQQSGYSGGEVAGAALLGAVGGFAVADMMDDDF